MSSSPKDAARDELGADEKEPTDLPFPSSLCHGCAARRYIRSGRGSVFILCPLLSQKYPRQPVSLCSLFQPMSDDSEAKKEK